LCVVSFVAGILVQRAYDGRSAADAGPGATPESTQTSTPSEPVVDFASEPLWAYGFEEPAKPGDKASPQAPPSRNLRPNEDANEQTRMRKLEGSSAEYSLVDIRDGGNVIDWFPDMHPPMPDIIKHGPSQMKEGRRGCGSCHLPTGGGRPENAPVAGLPTAYFVQQLKDFRSGARRSADPRKPNTNTMIALAKAMTDEEIQQAAEYFAAIKWNKRVEIVETNMVPKTRIVGNLFLATEKERTQPIAGRLIEVPADEERAESFRDPRSGFIAYVPEGTLEKGKHLVTLGGATIVNNQIVQGKTTPCTACHGPDLMGLAEAPPIAGRSPSYIARQLFDIQQGTRRGPGVELMKVVVSKLTPEDMVSIAAYVASKFPPDPIEADPNEEPTRTASR
jgi:cytochrome c553